MLSVQTDSSTAQPAVSNKNNQNLSLNYSHSGAHTRLKAVQQKYHSFSKCFKDLNSKQNVSLFMFTVLFYLYCIYLNLNWLLFFLIFTQVKNNKMINNINTSVGSQPLRIGSTQIHSES